MRLAVIGTKNDKLAKQKIGELFNNGLILITGNTGFDYSLMKYFQKQSIPYLIYHQENKYPKYHLWTSGSYKSLSLTKNETILTRMIEDSTKVLFFDKPKQDLIAYCKELNKEYHVF